MLLFSATLHSPEIRKFAEQITRFPTWVDLKGRDGAVPENVHHVYLRADPDADKAWQAPGVSKIETDGMCVCACVSTRLCMAI